MGKVFRARAISSSAEVALKVLRPELAGNEQFERRFAHEVRAARTLDHPHLVAVVDDGLDGAHRYLALDYVAGGTLHERLRSGGALALDAALRLAAEVGSAIDALHA